MSATFSTPRLVAEAAGGSAVMNTPRRARVEMLPFWKGEFSRWLRLCPSAGRFGWMDVGRLPPYCERS